MANDVFTVDVSREVEKDQLLFLTQKECYASWLSENSVQEPTLVLLPFAQLCPAGSHMVSFQSEDQLRLAERRREF